MHSQCAIVHNPRNTVLLCCQFVGVWYDIARVPVTNETFTLSSAISRYTLSDDHQHVGLLYGGHV